MKYTPQWRWLAEELTRVDREKTPWLIVIMHVPIYNSNVKHYTEGESMQSVYESWFVKAKVDFIFAGHVHAYERSVRISFPFCFRKFSLGSIKGLDFFLVEGVLINLM